MTNESSITIVTAFFDIGRGEWSKDKGYPSYLQRSVDKYFEYFSNLAKLENKIIVFTSKPYMERVKKIRGNKPTVIIDIDIDIDEKFKECKIEIEKIQNNLDFKNKVNPEQLQNPEYWSADYVLVTNLKAYFVKKAINLGFVATTLVAWVDFGYCRDDNTLNGVKEWQYPFTKNKIHFFTINKTFKINQDSVLSAILNNKVFIIGGAVVSSNETWLKFSNLVYDCQKKLLLKGIVDDDQGIFMMALLEDQNFFQLNYLGKDRWFNLFRSFDQTSSLGFTDKIKKFLDLY